MQPQAVLFLLFLPFAQRVSVKEIVSKIVLRDIGNLSSKGFKRRQLSGRFRRKYKRATYI